MTPLLQNLELSRATGWFILGTMKKRSCALHPRYEGEPLAFLCYSHQINGFIVRSVIQRHIQIWNCLAKNKKLVCFWYNLKRQLGKTMICLSSETQNCNMMFVNCSDNNEPYFLWAVGSGAYAEGGDQNKAMTHDVWWFKKTKTTTSMCTQAKTKTVQVTPWLCYFDFTSGCLVALRALSWTLHVRACIAFVFFAH